VSARSVSNDPSGSPDNVFIADEEASQLFELSPSGSQSTVPTTGLEGPGGLAVTPTGDLYSSSINADQVVEINATGVQSTVPVKKLGSPAALAVDSAGDLFIADSEKNKVIEISTSGVQTTVPATGLKGPDGVAVDSAGDVFIADLYNDRVEEVTPGGVQTTVPTTGLVAPTGLAVDDADDLYIMNSSANNVLEITPGGVQSTFTLPANGVGTGSGIAVDSAGNIFVAACWGVAEISPSGSSSIVPTSSLGCAAGIAAAPAMTAAPTHADIYGPTTVNAGETYTATAGDNGDPAAVFSLASTPTPPAGLTVDPTTGTVSYSPPPSTSTSSFSYAVVATNSQGSATSASMDVSVTANLIAPSSVTVTGPTSVLPGNTYTATATTNGNLAPTFTLGSAPAPPTGLTLNSTTGAISYSAPTGGGFEFGFTVVATNSQGSASTTVVVAVTVPTTEVTVLGPPTVNAGSTYVAVILSSNGVPGPTITLATAPVPPAGLEINPDFGFIEYTVPTSGVSSFSYAVVATNPLGSATSATVNVTVEPPLAAPSAVTVAGPASATAGTTYLATTSVAGYPAPTFSLASTPSAPPGLAVDPESGAVSYAVPGDISSFSFAVVATNSQGSATSPTVTVTVPNAGPTEVLVVGTPAINAGNSYTATARADGNPSPTYSIASVPTPPTGLSINAVTGVISYAVPASGLTQFSYAVVATNSYDSATSASVTVVVDPALAPTATAAICLQPDLQSSIDSGGTLDFVGDCTLNLTTPLTVPAGDTVTLNGNGHTVVLDGLNLTTGTRGQVFRVSGAALTLENLTVADGYAVGSDGSAGVPGEDGPNFPGGPGGDAISPGTAGTAGMAGQGGGLYIAAHSTVKVTSVDFSNDDAAGGIGGSGGIGGMGGYGSQGAGAFGNSGGNGSKAGNGAAGGAGQGGAIFNAGSLSITKSAFDNDDASGGGGGSAGPGGAGGSGAFVDAAFVFAGNGGKGGDGGNGANGGTAQGGAVYSTGKLTLTSIAFSDNGANGGLGGSATVCDYQLPGYFDLSSCGTGYAVGGGWGGNSGGSPDGPVFGDGGNGGKGGKGGKGANAAGGAVWSSGKTTVAGITFSGDFVNSGHAGEDCANSPLTLGCGGVGGLGGAPNGFGSDGTNGDDGANGPGGTATNVDVYAPSTGPLAITTASLKSGTKGKAYSAILAASGGTLPYAWTALGLPGGLTLSNAGVMSGKPSSSGTFSVTITVADPTAATPATVSKLFSLTIKSGKKKH
jgi:hypothetical protein